MSETSKVEHPQCSLERLYVQEADQATCLVPREAREDWQAEVEAPQTPHCPLMLVAWGRGLAVMTTPLKRWSCAQC